MAFAPFGPGRLPSPVFTPYTPADVSPAEETSIAPPAAPSVAPPAAPPTVPSFGQPVATPPFVAPSPAGPTLPQTPPHQGAPNFFSAVMPILAAALAGGKDPRAVGEGLAAFQRGRQLKLAEQEHVQDRTAREQKEAAAFYGRMIDQSQTIDDPIDFRHYQDSVAPMAKLYGIDPYTAITFSNGKLHAQESARVAAAVQKILDNGDAGSEERVRTGDFSVKLANGRTISGKDALGMIDTVTDRDGNLIVKKKTVTPISLGRDSRLIDPTTNRVLVDAAPGGDKRGFVAKDITVDGKRTSANYDPDTGKYYDLQTGAVLTGKILDYDKPTAEPRGRFNIQQVTKPDGSTGLVRVNMDTGDVSPVALPDGAGAGKASDTQLLSKAYLDRTVASDTTAATFEASLAKLGPQLDVQLPNLLKSEQGQQYKQAENEFINAALRRESGAAIQPSEYARFEEIYFVRPGDTAATIAQKQASRKRVVDGFRVASGSMGAAAKTGPKVGERRTINGKLGEWDGKGWKPVAP